MKWDRMDDDEKKSKKMISLFGFARPKLQTTGLLEKLNKTFFLTPDMVSAFNTGGKTQFFDFNWLAEVAKSIIL